MTEREIFLAAIEIADPQEREEYLAQACRENEDLKSQVDELLRLHGEAADFLEAAPVPGVISEPGTEDVEAMSDGRSEFVQFLSPSERPETLGRLAHYQIEEILGRGAFGIVAKAVDERLQRIVAIKMLCPALAVTSPPRKRFLREAQIAAAVTHENIVAIHAVEEEPIPYLVMEYVPGNTLQQLLDNQGPLDVRQTLSIGRQIATGLVAAHAHHLIHRDIKPSNIILATEPENRVKISDFGLARVIDDGSLTASGVVAGTPQYMAPEQARGERLDHRADLFSLGSLLYQVVSGHPPFRAGNAVAVLKRVCEDTPRPLDEVISDTPPWLCGIINCLMEKDPDQRYQSAQEVAEVFARCEQELNEHGTVQKETWNKRLAHSAGRSPSDTRRKGRPARPIGWLVGLIVGIALTVLLSRFSGVNDAGNRPRSAETKSEFVAVRPENNTVEKAGWHGWSSDAPTHAIVPFSADKALAYQQQWAEYLKAPVEFENSLGMKFRLIPPGQFVRGSTPEEIEAAVKRANENEFWKVRIESEGPQHEVILTHPFYLGVTEVTQSQFESLMGENPSHFSGSGEGKEIIAGLDTSNHPVEMVSWKTAAEFCTVLSTREDLKPFYFQSEQTVTSLEGNGYRLPTEAEWEFACRAGSSTRFCTGDDDDMMRAGWCGINSGRRSHGVGEMLANAFGLFDMHGNVQEWAHDGWEQDSYLHFAESTAIDPVLPFSETSRCALRGGGFYAYPTHCSSSSRFAQLRTTKL